MSVFDRPTSKELLEAVIDFIDAEIKSDSYPANKKFKFQIVLNVSLEDTQKKLDKALKRNLGGQPQPVAAAKAPTSELPVDEPISDNDEPIDE